MIKEGLRVTVKDTKLENFVSTSGVKFIFALIDCFENATFPLFISRSCIEYPTCILYRIQ